MAVDITNDFLLYVEQKKKQKEFSPRRKAKFVNIESPFLASAAAIVSF